MDLKRIEAAVREILLAIGENPDREGLARTPLRVAHMYEELFSGMNTDPSELLTARFSESYDELVVLRVGSQAVSIYLVRPQRLRMLACVEQRPIVIGPGHVAGHIGDFVC